MQNTNSHNLRDLVIVHNQLFKFTPNETLRTFCTDGSYNNSKTTRNKFTGLNRILSNKAPPPENLINNTKTKWYNEKKTSMSNKYYTHNYAHCINNPFDTLNDFTRGTTQLSTILKAPIKNQPNFLWTEFNIMRARIDDIHKNE